MKVLVTAGTGIISEGIVRECLKRGYETYTFTRGTHPERFIEGAYNFVGNVHNLKSIQEQIGSGTFDIVVECLGMTVENMRTSLQAFSGICKHYFYISSVGVYERNNGEPISENHPLNQMGWSIMNHKVECEQYLRNFATEHELKYTIIRPTVTYSGYRVPFPVVSKKNQWTICQRILDNKPIISMATNTQFSVLHIDDFAPAVVGLFCNPKAYNEEFHIASDDSVIEWDDVINCAAEILGKQVTIIHIPLELFKYTFYDLYDELKWNKAESLVLNTAKLKDALPEYIPQKNIKEGMKDAIPKLEHQFQSYNRQLDNEFDLNCDLIMYLAMKKGKLREDEKSYVINYINSKGSLEKLKFTILLVIYHMTKPTKAKWTWVKHQIKSLASKCIRNSVRKK